MLQTRRSDVSITLIFNTPSPYQTLEQKEGRSLDLKFISRSSAVVAVLRVLHVVRVVLAHFFLLKDDVKS